ncbi:MAG: hypothetical protein ACRDK7_00580 [Solirubrobacteraceae bacterium]
MNGTSEAAPIRHVAALAVALIGVLLLAASVARAGEWAQVGCTQPNGQPAPIEGWTPEALNGPGDYSSAYSTCAQAGGALVAQSSNQWPQARYSGYVWHYAAPNGSTIAGGTLSLNLYSPEGQAYIATPANSYPSDVVMNCQFNLPCSENGPDGGPFVGTVPIDHPGGTNIYAEAECLGPGQPGTSTESCPVDGGGGGVNAQAVIYAADVELANESTPTASGFSGPLLQGAVSGTADLTFNAQDPGGPGVFKVIAELDNTTAYEGTPEANGGRCASIGADAHGVSEFLYAQPCKQNIAVELPVNTTRFANGQHALKVTVSDAAGNTSVVYDGTISIDNPLVTASSLGVVGGPVRGAANGTNASEEATLTARWAATSNARLTSSYGRPHTITGRLTGPGGVPISGAVIDLTATPAYAGAKPVTMSSPRTKPNGRFQLHLPGDVSSRTLLLAYRSHLADEPAVTEHTLTLHVRAAITLGIAPHVANVGRRIFFRGVLHGGPIPPAGKQLVLEARSPGSRWIEFDVIRTDARGHFRASYRFRLPGPHDYRFRILSKYESDFPFVAGTSNIVDVQEQ